MASNAAKAKDALAHEMSSSGDPKRDRFAALDGLRGVAIFVVLVHHIRAVYAASLNETVLPGAFLGVDLFFVLSGFLITGLLVREHHTRNRVRLGAFYRRRALRLYPALVALLAAQAVYAAQAHLPWAIERPALQSIFLYYFNWRQTIFLPEGIGHLWSLSVEEQFYLVWPVVLIGVFALTRTRRRYVVPLVVTAILLVLLYRAWRWNDGMFWLWMYQRTDTRVDSLLIGALLGVLLAGLEPPRDFFVDNHWLSPAAWISTATLLACVLFVHVDGTFVYVGGFTLVAMASAIVVVAVLPGSPWIGARALQYRPLCALGIVSYGIYLWHLPVFVATQRYGKGIPPVLRVLLALGLTALFTALSWFFVERPCLRWKDRLEARSLARLHAERTAR